MDGETPRLFTRARRGPATGAKGCLPGGRCPGTRRGSRPEGRKRGPRLSPRRSRGPVERPAPPPGAGGLPAHPYPPPPPPIGPIRPALATPHWARPARDANESPGAKFKPGNDLRCERRRRSPEAPGVAASLRTPRPPGEVVSRDPCPVTPVPAAASGSPLCPRGGAGGRGPATPPRHRARSVGRLGEGNA